MANLGRREWVVIGGGLVGASIAWGLARAGAQPLVLDEGDLAPRASRANFALVWVQGKGVGHPAYALWTRAAAERWPRLAAELEAETGIDVALRQPGGFTFCLSPAELEREQADVEQIAREAGQRAPGYQVLGHAETRERLPRIGSGVAGSIYSPCDGHVNVLLALRALHAAMAARGCDYRAGHPVRVIEPVADGFRIRGDWGELVAGKLVLAAGLGCERLAPMVGLACPLKWSRGQVIVTEKCAPFFPYASTAVLQADEGGFLIGASQDASESILTCQEVSAVMARRAVQVFPALAAVNVVRTWAGFRVKTRDGFPVYDQSASAPGAFIVAGHSGVTLAAGHAFALAPQILAGRLGPEFGPYSARRFLVPQDH